MTLEKLRMEGIKVDQARFFFIIIIPGNKDVYCHFDLKVPEI